MRFVVYNDISTESKYSSFSSYRCHAGPCLDAHSLKQLYAGCLTLELSIQTVQLWLTEHKLNWTMRLSTYQQQTQRVAMKYFD